MYLFILEFTDACFIHLLRPYTRTHTLSVGAVAVKNRNADYARISTELPLAPASADEKSECVGHDWLAG